MWRKGRKWMAGLALAATLLAGTPALAAGTPVREGFLARVWQWVQALWADNGACIDPNGAPCAPHASSDAGPHIDPDG